MTTTPKHLHTIYYVPFVLPPFDEAGVLQQEYTGLPESWLTALQFLARDIGQARCENGCGAAIGYHLDLDRQLQWRTAYLAKLEGHGIVRLCMNCSPMCPTPPPTGWLSTTEQTA